VDLHTLALACAAIIGSAWTLIGNPRTSLSLIVGSIANMIVVDGAARRGIRIYWHRHARVGVPVTLATLSITVWLALRVAHAASA
jgi:Na+/H+ antiporter NhaD/arsenite permease-like protein